MWSSKFDAADGVAAWQPANVQFHAVDERNFRPAFYELAVPKGRRQCEGTVSMVLLPSG